MNTIHPPPSDLALWRYGIISPLLHRDPGGRTKQEILEDLSRPEYRFPDGHLQKISSETFRKWLTRYRIGGLASLDDQERCDKGRTSIPSEIIERIRSLREEHPRWTLAVLFRRLLEEKLWNGRSPSGAALYRFCRASGLERKPSLEGDCRSFAFEDFGNLWIADFLHGPKLLINKQKRKTYVHVILDDATRYVVAAGIHLHEDVEVLIGELKQAIRCHGIPQRFYTDNGSAYRSRHLRIVGARLQLQMPHTPPYRPQGRGKIERFFRTLREQFLAVTPAKSLQELSRGLQEWLAVYHQSLHDSLGCSPLQKRVITASVCRRVPESIPIEPLFLMERRCRVYSDGTIRFKRGILEVPLAPPGKRVTIYFDPTDPIRVWYGEDFQPARMLDRHRNAHRFERPPARKELP